MRLRLGEMSSFPHASYNTLASSSDGSRTPPPQLPGQFQAENCPPPQYPTIILHDVHSWAFATLFASLVQCAVESDAKKI